MENKTIRIDDVMQIQNDDLIILNQKERRDRSFAPQGELFQVLGYKDGRRIVKKIDHNLVVVGGAISALKNLTTGVATWEPSTLNDIHGIPAVGTGEQKIMLFGAGSGGANLTFGSIIAPDIKQRDILNPLPMRYSNVPLTGIDSDKYFMKKAVADTGYTAYYLKEFSNIPVIKSCWKDSVDEEVDGTEITAPIYNSPRTEGIETFVEFDINFNNYDVREYYKATSELANARYNTIGFYTGSKNAEGTEYGDVRLYSVVTFNNRDVSIATSVNFLYRVYSLI